MRQRDHLVELDGLRGIAVLGVLLAHLAFGSICHIPIGMAHHGVDLFFALSGFLITRIRLFEQERGIGLRAFWTKRITRIFPAAWLCLTIVAVGWGFSSHILMGYAYLTTFDVSLMSMQSPPPVGHFWTLSVEEQFYLLWPVVLLAPIRIVIAIAMLSLLSCLGFFSGMGIYTGLTCADGPVIEMLDHQLFTRGWPLLAGSLIAILEPKIRVNPKILLWMTGTSTVIGVMLRSILLVHLKMGGCNIQSFRLMGGQFLAFAIFSIVLYAAITEIRTPFRFSGLRWVGEISYGLYLYHLPIYFAWDVQSNPERWPIVVGLSFLAATVSYYFFERPIVRWGRKMAIPKTASEPVSIRHAMPVAAHYDS